MDLTIQLEGIKLNIRVAILIKTAKGYLFEKGNNGYLFTLGGRVKIGETSFDAAKREVFEEIAYDIKDIKLTAIVENFFGPVDAKVQEICFVYSHEGTVDIKLPAEFVELKASELADQDIRPEVMKKIIHESKDGINHYIIK